eukprot:6852872-Pyramimonas_sp.AAC.1
MSEPTLGRVIGFESVGRDAKGYRVDVKGYGSVDTGGLLVYRGGHKVLVAAVHVPMEAARVVRQRVDANGYRVDVKGYGSRYGAASCVPRRA